jgi:hypothetical protein
MASEELGFLRKTNGLVLALIAAAALAATLAGFRPRRPSPFTSAGAYGAGHGTESIMFGASPRLGAAR